MTAPTISILSASALVGAGLMDGSYTTRLGATAHGGVTVRVTSSNPGVLLLSRNATSVGAAFVDVPVANGNTDATYYIHGVEGARGTVTLTATAPGFTQAQATATVGDPALRLIGPPSTTTTLSPDSPFIVQLGVLNSTGVFAAVQALRAGAHGGERDDQPHESGGRAAGDHGGDRANTDRELWRGISARRARSLPAGLRSIRLPAGQRP